jgi:hypothetical protein
MYLAKRVGRWSLSQIGRFYNGRHHTTVLHAIEKIETLRRTDESIDALIDVLTTALSPDLQTAASPLPQSSLRSGSSKLWPHGLSTSSLECDRIMDRNPIRCRNSCPRELNTVHISVGVGAEEQAPPSEGTHGRESNPASLPK